MFLNILRGAANWSRHGALRRVASRHGKGRHNTSGRCEGAVRAASRARVRGGRRGKNAAKGEEMRGDKEEEGNMM